MPALELISGSHHFRSPTCPLELLEFSRWISSIDTSRYLEQDIKERAGRDRDKNSPSAPPVRELQFQFAKRGREVDSSDSVPELLTPS